MDRSQFENEWAKIKEGFSSKQNEQKEYLKDSKEQNILGKIPDHRYKEILNDFDGKIDNLKFDTSEALKKLESDYKGVITEKAKPTSEDINRYDLDLIKTGELSQGELCELMEKHEGNATMEKLITKYAENNGNPIMVKTTLEKEMESIDIFVSQNGLRY